MFEIVDNAILKAGSVLIELQRNALEIQNKNSHDVLAEADLASEKIIIDAIRENFPDHSIYSEESGKQLHDSKYRWIIDPLDGTLSFLSGLDEYCISVALEVEANLEYGVIYIPKLNKFYRAAKDKGATLNNQSIIVSNKNSLKDVIAACDMTSKESQRSELFNLMKNISKEVRQIRMFGSCAIHLAYLAEGKFGVYFKNASNYWDFAAGIIMVREAGGNITDFEGNKFDENSKNIIAANNSLHSHSMELLNSI